MSKRILVVEDDFDISNMLRIYFGGQGYEVEVAPKGEEALASVNKAGVGRLWRIGHGYWPLKLGFRLSMKARRPSM